MGFFPSRYFQSCRGYIAFLLILGACSLSACAGGSSSSNSRGDAPTLLDNSSISITGQPPASSSPTVNVVSVAAPPSGTYGLGAQIDFQVTWSEAMTVTGSPLLALTVGSTQRNANYLSGSGTSTLNFRYTVQARDSDADGIMPASAVSLNGGGIVGASSGHSGNLNTSSYLGTLTGVLVNTATTPPDSVQNVSIAPTTSNTELAISWSVPANNGTAITYYLLQYREQGDDVWTTRSPNPSSNSATLSGLQAGVVYEIRVAAFNGVLGPFSTTQEAEIFDIMSFSPIAWLDGTDVLGNGTSPADGSSVASWVDKTGTAQNATEANVALQPTYETNVQNGLIAVRFANLDRGLQGSFTRSNGTSLTIFVVGQFDSGYSDRCMFEFIGGGGTARAFFIDRRYAANTFYNPALTQGSFHLWRITNSGAQASVVQDGTTTRFNGATTFNTNLTGTGT
jgi:hypothetical protein